MKRIGLALITGSVVALSGLTSCSPASMSESGAPMTESAVESDYAVPDDSLAQAVSDAEGTTVQAEQQQNESQQRPQLIKRASLVLKVESMEETLAQVRSLTVTQQGDILSLQDQGDSNRSVSMELRVPQYKLDIALDELSEMGTIRSRSISSEDVSSQLVDLQARLSNARKSEEALQEIMSRSGEISDVLEVSRELSNIRQSIEQMAAAQKNLQTQVRYSTINLRLESAIAASPTEVPFARQLSNTWTAATHSFGTLTTNLLQLGLWLLVYSPYIFVVLCGVVLLNRVRQSTPSDS